MVFQLVSQYEAGEYWRRNPGFHREDSLFKARNVVNALESCDIGNNIRACDVGCGAGAVLHHVGRLLAERGIEVHEAHGYDDSEEAVAEANRLFPHIKYKVGSAIDVPAGYDVMLVMDVLEHLENYYEFLRALRHKASTYVFHIPMEMNVCRILHKTDLLEGYRAGHIHQFCETTALEVLSATGFQPVHCRWTDVDLHQAMKTAGRVSWKRKVIRVLRKMIFPIVPDFTVALLGGKSLLVVAKDATDSEG